MTKETSSTFLPIVNIGIRAKPVKSIATNPEIKLLKVSVLFLWPSLYHVIDSLQSCMSITWDVWPLVPLLVRCVVCLQFTPTVFSYNWVAFLKSPSSFDFEQWKKISQRRREIVIDGRSICRSWLWSSACSWLPEKQRVVHNRSGSVQKYHSFNQLSSNHFKQSISYCLVFIIRFCRDRDHRQGVIKIRPRAVSYVSFGHGRMRARARGERRSR